MKIEFESREEIRRMASLLQDIFPAALCLTTDDLLDVRDNCADRALPWGPDGLHLPLVKIETGEDSEERLYTHEEIFQDCVWEEVDQDGQKFLRRVKSGSEPFNSLEYDVFEAGRLAAIFQLYQDRTIELYDGMRATGRTEPEFLDLCKTWARHAITERRREGMVDAK